MLSDPRSSPIKPLRSFRRSTVVKHGHTTPGRLSRTARGHIQSSLIQLPHAPVRCRPAYEEAPYYKQLAQHICLSPRTTWSIPTSLRIVSIIRRPFSMDMRHPSQPSLSLWTLLLPRFSISRISSTNKTQPLFGSDQRYQTGTRDTYLHRSVLHCSTLCFPSRKLRVRITEACKVHLPASIARPRQILRPIGARIREVILHDPAEEAVPAFVQPSHRGDPKSSRRRRINRPYKAKEIREFELNCGCREFVDFCPFNRSYEKEKNKERQTNVGVASCAPAALICRKYARVKISVANGFSSSTVSSLIFVHSFNTNVCQRNL